MAIDGTVVVTGGANGIGRALAVEGAARGASIVVLDRDDAAGTIKAVEAVGSRADAYVLDVTDQEAFAAAAEEILAKPDDLTTVIANVGVGAPGALIDVALEDVARVLDVNVVGTFRTVRTFLPRLRESAEKTGQAHVVITGSEHSLGLPPDQVLGAYTVAKHALLGLADVLRTQLKGTGVSVTLLAPGWTTTRGVLAYLEQDPAAAETVYPVAQSPEEVATVGWDAIEAGHFLAPTNLHSESIAQERIAEIQRGFAALRK
ncbi:SDR family NAD(P)-dependent oxidoreductase [Actinomadura sp. LD22]|uniref:SDR family NAD(P)-dependent oxidoreductase n=1 Tax=Actinomadura physcomitrii TaxID=2650748 RepID=A0A6I4MGJ7_9ACTN|nr:SDR family oxidoreductase [Actinomadura physcomitrii]MWA04843.1 SDR family NAD(P)-dependent oxidoreductase [Actinomadura physcomitrii]